MTTLVGLKPVRARKASLQRRVGNNPILREHILFNSTLSPPKHHIPSSVRMPKDLRNHARPHDQSQQAQQRPHTHLMPIIPRLRDQTWTRAPPATRFHLRLVQIVRDAVVIRAINLHLRSRRASHANLRIALFQLLPPFRQRGFILSVPRVVLVRQVVGQRLVVDLLVVQAGVAEDLLRLVAARRVAGRVAGEALEGFVGSLRAGGGGIWSVDDVALGVEEVVGFAGGALEV